MPKAPKTPTWQFRMDPFEWAEFGSDAELMGTDRSEVIRQLIAWWMRRTGAKLPRRPPARATRAGELRGTNS
jgi:hypothetical protein